MEILKLAQEILEHLERSRLSPEEKCAALEATKAVIAMQAEVLGGARNV